jgi:hypothetical protein
MKIKDYWAVKPADELVGELDSKDRALQNANQNQMMIRNSRHYFDTDTQFLSDSSLKSYGDNDEFISAACNEARSLIRNMVSLVTSDRLNFECISMSDDESVFAVNKTAKAIIDDVVNRKNLDKLQDTAVETALIFGSSFYHVTWNTAEGEPYLASATKKQVLYEGDINISVLNPFEIIFDRRVNSWENVDWCVIKKRVNKWTLIAQFPNLKDELESADSSDVSNHSNYNDVELENYQENDDLVLIHEFYHKPTPALPNGRMCVYANENTIIFDGNNIYECLPVVPVIPMNKTNTLHGYPLYSDLMPMQEMLDNEIACIASNHSAFGVSNVLVPDTSDMRVEDLQGMRFIKYNADSGGVPSVLNLAQTSVELFKFIDVCKGQMAVLSGINEAARGNPPSGVTSGVAIATLSANSLKLASPFLKSNTIALEQVMLKVVKFFKMFATTERILPVLGANQQYTAFRFDSSKIEEVKSIKVRPQNPLMQTLSGRVEVADNLLEKGMIQNPSDYLRLIQTGELNEMTDEVVTEIELIASENEELKQGQSVPVLALDNHTEHISKHKMLLNNPLIRRNSNVIGIVLQHIEEHLEILRTGDPMILELAETGTLSPDTVMNSRNPNPVGGAMTPPSPEMENEMSAEPTNIPAEPLQVESPLQQGAI